MLIGFQLNTFKNKFMNSISDENARTKSDRVLGFSSLVINLKAMNEQTLLKVMNGNHKPKRQRSKMKSFMCSCV